MYMSPSAISRLTVTIFDAPKGYKKTDFKHYAENGKIEISVDRIENEEIPLHFYCEVPNLCNDDVKGDYTAVRIGEHLWTTRNFSHLIPARGPKWYDDIFGFTHWKPIDSDLFLGMQVRKPLTQATLDTYMPCHLMDPSVYQLDDINAFYKYYGGYYNWAEVEYMGGFKHEHTQQYHRGYGRMLEGKERIEKPWRIPSQGDFAQLFAMCDLIPGMDYLSEQAVEFDLGARLDDNPLARHISSNGQVVGWFDAVKNTFGFEMMPNGERLHAAETWTNDLGYWSGSKGDITFLFQAETFFTMEDNGLILSIKIHDSLAFPHEKTWKWKGVRFCRRLTPKELGYELYINSNLTDIKKLSPSATPPSGYKRLPNGYLRGFYVKYILNNSNPQKTLAEIIQLTRNTIIANTKKYPGHPIDEIVPLTERNMIGARSFEEKEKIEEISDMVNELRVYPNPAIDYLYINGNFSSAKLINIGGRIVISTTENKINVQDLPKGVYIFKSRNS